MIQRRPSPMAVALAGLSALAIAMGVGRFAFTPILPMMRDDAGLSVAGGAWLASANYFGFLLAALSAMRLRTRPTSVIRGGLVVIGIVTVGMGLADRFAAWIILRGIAGMANAWVQILALAWCLERLAAHRRPLLDGVVFAGVGTGISVAGGFCLALMQAGTDSRDAWIGLGLISLAVTALVWRTFDADDGPAARHDAPAPGWPRDAESLRLVLCFGASGLGYIIPATFLPLMARERISDPLVFGWSWPMFGVAAVVAPLATAAWTRRMGNRRLWIASHLAMAFGVSLPVWWPAMGGIMIAALVVGGTFMVNAMAAMREARAVAGPRATSLMAAMTAAFGTGQIVGPVSVSALVGAKADFSTLLLASFVLVASAYALSRRIGPRAGSSGGAGGQQLRPVAEHARELIDQRADAGSPLHVRVDDEPDVERVRLLGWKRPHKTRRPVAHEAGEIARSPAEAHRFEHGCDAVRPESDAAARHTVLEVQQGQLQAVGIADRAELPRPLPRAADVGRHRHAAELARHQGRLGGPHGADGDVGLSPGQVEAGDGADQLDGDPRVPLIERLQRGQDEVAAEDLRRGDPHPTGKLPVGTQRAALGGQRRPLHLLGGCPDPLARRGDLESAGRTLEEGGTHPLLQASQAARHGGLVDP
jgi:predicted MFS family arabinose efflux permease